MTLTDYTVASVTRAMRVLSAFERAPHSFRLSDLADQLGMTRNLTFRLLRTLEADGMVFRLDDRYTLGPRAKHLGSLALARFRPLAERAQPILQALTRTTGETTYLCALEGLDGVLIAVAETDSPIRGVPRIGQRLPLHIGGGTKALLAALPDELQDAILDQSLPRTPTPVAPGRAGMRSHLAEIARHGYAVALEEASPGADAVGVVVRDFEGAPIAGLGLVGPTDRVRDRLHTELRERVAAAGTAISVALWPRPVDASELV
jgi:DNA-binding IclR family transcriptional regulator